MDSSCFCHGSSTGLARKTALSSSKSLTNSYSLGSAVHFSKAVPHRFVMVASNSSIDLDDFQRSLLLLLLLFFLYCEIVVWDYELLERIVVWETVAVVFEP